MNTYEGYSRRLHATFAASASIPRNVPDPSSCLFIKTTFARVTYSHLLEHNTKVAETVQKSIITLNNKHTRKKL